MRKFVQILEGESANTARPILVTEDQEVVRAVGRELAKRLGGEREKPLTLVPRDDREDPRP